MNTLKRFRVIFSVNGGTAHEWIRFAENLEAANASASEALFKEFPSAAIEFDVKSAPYDHTMFLTVSTSGVVLGLYAFGDRLRELPSADPGLRLGTWGDIARGGFLQIADSCRVIVLRGCERCGAARHHDQSCGCFDNGSE